MSTRGWRPSWSTPGQSESSSARLDVIINRNLTVKGQIKSPITSWIPYTPTVIAYTTAAGRGAASPAPSTGMVYTATGQWKEIASVIFFYFDVQITTKGTGFNSNPYVTLPPVKPVTMFSCQGITQPLNNTDDSKWNQLFGLAKTNAVDILVGPSSYAAPTVFPNLTFPLEFSVSGAYQAVLP